AAGGAATAAYVTGLAAVAPIIGRSIDLYGPRRILLACAILFPAALLALIAAVLHGAAMPAVLALGGLAGACFPPITVCIRTFFKQRFLEEQHLVTAYSVESILIEIIFIAGPLLVALLVAAASAAAAVAAAALSGLAGTLLFLRTPALRGWRIESRNGRALLGALGERGFLGLLAMVLLFSTAFGLLEIGVTAYATSLGDAALAGVLLGLMSVGSALGGLAYGSRTWRAPLESQFALMLGVMGAGLTLLALQWGPWAFAGFAFLAGIVMAPALIIQSTLVAKTVRAAYTTEAFTWSTSALLAGVGIGLAGGGALLEVLPYRAAFAAAGATAALAALGVVLLGKR
ncbi:MAG: MFS transporter, partial [Betaproteobacteria bacterium]